MTKEKREEPNRPSAFEKRGQIRPELIEELLKDYSSPEDLIGPDGLLRELMSALVSRAMQAELAHHLGYAHGEEAPMGQANRRNGTSRKKVRTDRGPIEVRVPRSLEPIRLRSTGHADTDVPTTKDMLMNPDRTSGSEY